MANIVLPFVALPLAPVPSVGFNNNFTEIATKFNTYAVQTDVAKVITVGHTWNASQTFAAGLLLQGDLLFTDALYDIGKAGATRPRDLFLSRSLTVGLNLSVNSAGTFGSLVTSDSWMMEPLSSVFASGIERCLTGDNSSSLNLAYNVPTGGKHRFAIAGSFPFEVSGTGLLLNGIGITVGGDMLFNADALFDIGKAGATRPRDLFISRNFVAGGNVSGSLKATGSATNAGLVLDLYSPDPIGTLVNGEMWINTTAPSLRVRMGGATKFVQTAASKVVGDQITGWTVQTTAQTRGDMGAAPVVGVVATTLAALIADLRTHGLIAT